MKLKTRQSMVKRFKVMKNGKVLKRKNGQAHFNSGESRKVTRMKRRDVTFGDKFAKTVRRALLK